MATPFTSTSSAAARSTAANYENEPAAGIIRNVTISNVIAHGQGTSAMQGHPDSWLQGIRLNHVRLFVSHGADAPYESTTAAMTLRYARDVAMNDVEIRWEEPHTATWQSGLTAGSGPGPAPRRHEN